jgi:CRP-like cAMP-binding protein
MPTPPTPREIFDQAPDIRKLDPQIRQQLWEKSTTVQRSAGDILMVEGVDGDGSFYLVVDGKLKVALAVGATFERGPGEFCGEMALMTNNHKRTATVTVEEPSRLLMWTYEPTPEYQSLMKALGTTAWERAVANASQI